MHYAEGFVVSSLNNKKKVYPRWPWALKVSPTQGQTLQLTAVSPRKEQHMLTWDVPVPLWHFHTQRSRKDWQVLVGTRWCPTRGQWQPPGWSELDCLQKKAQHKAEKIKHHITSGQVFYVCFLFFCSTDIMWKFEVLPSHNKPTHRGLWL